MRFYCVVDDLPEESPRLLREACAVRQIEYVEIDAPTFDYDPAHKPHAADLLFRPAASRASMRVEQFLFSAGVATFYEDAQRVFYDTTAARLLFEAAGVPQPRAIFCATAERGVLDGYVARLGGLPVIVKLLGSEGGRGTIKIDTWSALYSTLEFCADHGLASEMTTFVPDAMHWRIVVVDSVAVAAYPNPIRERDFRSSPSNNPADYTRIVDPGLASLAVSATRAMGLGFSGVDVLRAAAGGDYVLEVNFPCYFPQAQVMAGIDVAGAIVEGLAAKARRGGTVSGPGR